VAFPQIVPHLPERWSQIGLVLTGIGAISLGRNPNGAVGQMSDYWQRFEALLRGRATGSSPRWTRPEGEVIGVVALGDG
jgi:hypothetical protein